MTEHGRSGCLVIELYPIARMQRPGQAVGERQSDNLQFGGQALLQFGVGLADARTECLVRRVDQYARRALAIEREPCRKVSIGRESQVSSSADDAAMEDEGGRRKHQRRGHLRGNHGGPQSAEADPCRLAG